MLVREEQDGIVLEIALKYPTIALSSGLLTGCAGAGPHNSNKAAQFRTISENLRNPAQY